MRFATCCATFTFLALFDLSSLAGQDKQFPEEYRAIARLVQTQGHAAAFRHLQLDTQAVRKRIADRFASAQPQDLAQAIAESLRELTYHYELGLTLCIGALQPAADKSDTIPVEQKILWAVNSKAINREVYGRYSVSLRDVKVGRPGLPAEVTSTADLVRELKHYTTTRESNAPPAAKSDEGFNCRPPVKDSAALIVIAEFNTAPPLGPPGSEEPESYAAAIVGSDGKLRFVPLAVYAAGVLSKGSDIAVLVKAFGAEVKFATDPKNRDSLGALMDKSIPLGDFVVSRPGFENRSRFYERLNVLKQATLDAIDKGGFPIWGYGTWIVAPAAQLWLVPFQAMVKAIDKNGGQVTSITYVLDEHRLFYAFSGRDLAQWSAANATRVARKASTPLDILLYGPPSLASPSSTPVTVPPPKRSAQNAMPQSRGGDSTLPAIAASRGQASVLHLTDHTRPIEPAMSLVAWNRHNAPRYSCQRSYSPCVRPPTVFPCPTPASCGCGSTGRQPTTTRLLDCAPENGIVVFPETLAQDRNPSMGKPSSPKGDRYDRDCLDQIAWSLHKKLDNLKLSKSEKWYSGNSATEGTLRALLAGRGEGSQPPELLVFVTHGCFLSKDASKLSDKQKLAASLLALHDASNPSQAVANLLTLRGADSDNAIVNALEVTKYFDLRGTRLTMLIGCETGSGEVSGDSVAALRHAFTIAMADNGGVIATSWPVEFTSTTKWIDAFGARYLNSGQELADAMRCAALAVKSNPEWRHPLFWAPFLLTGNPASLGPTAAPSGSK